MPRLPPLPLGPPASRARTKGRPGRSSVSGPSPKRQGQRLGGQFARLTQAFDDERLTTVTAPEGGDPEQIIVLEIAGEIADFQSAVLRVPGLEFLAEEVEEDLPPDSDFAVVDKQGRRRKFGRELFVVASDRQAWGQILTMWQRYHEGRPLPNGLTAFRHLFEQTLQIRPWSDIDRLKRTNALEVWSEELTGLDAEPVDIEIELWFRTATDLRASLVAAVEEDLIAVGGAMIETRAIPEIAYHGVLASVPASRLLALVDRPEIEWLRAGPIRFMRPTGQLAAVDVTDQVDEGVAVDGASPPDIPSQLAILDGLPLSAHELLNDRIVVDDPDDWAATTPSDR